MCTAGVYCCLELDEYGKFERKARTIPTTTDNPTLVTSWDQVSGRGQLVYL